MSYYDTFLAINKSPKEFYLDQMQELVTESFNNSSTVQNDIEEEIAFGTLKFSLCEARITSLIDVNTGKRINDDVKKILFKDLGHTPILGTRYRFEDNIWITINTDNIKTATSSVYVQRCNSTLNSQDQYGNVHEEPCFVDFNVTASKRLIKASIDNPSGKIEVKCQLNDYTKNIGINDRFIFGGNVYKLKDISKPNRLQTFDKDSVTLLSFISDYDDIAKYDDLITGVADSKSYNYSIICQSDVKNIVGTSDTMKSIVYLDGKVVIQNVLWYSSNKDIVDIDETTGAYTLKAIGNCLVTCKMKNNINYFTTINIEVVSSIDNKYQNIITPNTEYITLNQVQNYEVYEYNNGIKTDTTFTITNSDAPVSNYIFKSTNNTFSVTNLKCTDDILLKVSCKNNKTLELVTILIELGGMF